LSNMFFSGHSKRYKKICKICGEEKIIADILGVCRDCIINNFSSARKYIKRAHAISREYYGLPPSPPKEGKLVCNICANICRFERDNTISYCGLRWSKNGMIRQLSDANHAVMYPYLDPHVTNCCASWFCPAGTGLGYPEYATRNGPEFGYYNLAVFFYGCNFNCLFCQNAEHKNVREGKIYDLNEFVDIVISNEKITCICYFGGSPEPHLPFTIRANKTILESLPKKRILRICYEWNGAGNSVLVLKAAEQIAVSGGIIKFDLKTPKNSPLSIALSGVPNGQTYKNFEKIYYKFWEETKIPILTATTLIVPGYITPDDVEEIAKFVAELNPDIPYSLLVFHPDWMMRDLPISPTKLVYECENVAKKYLNRVHVGNKFLLSMAPEKL